MPTRHPLARVLSATGLALCLAGALPSGAAAQTSISGRPPINAAQRHSPRLYDFTFGCSINTQIPPVDASYRQIISVADAPIVLPVILQGPYSMADPTSFTARLTIDGRPVGNVGAPRIDQNMPFGMAYAVTAVTTERAQIIQWEMGYRMQSWSSRVDEALAARAAWPQAWPDECADALKPQMFIESEDPRFRAFVDRVSGGQLRAAPVYLAAKDLVRATIQAIQVADGATARGWAGVLQGMHVRGAAAAMQAGRGSAHDVVCACVAVLRAAGIPARPVIGIDRDIVDRKTAGFVSWAEFYLPESGWIPFDPDRIRGTNFARANVRDAWRGFGTIPELNERLPLSYAYVPPAGGLISHGFPAVWGWDPRPTGAPSSTQQFVNLQSTSRGPGKDDPR